jgi:hypothetical protein
MLSAHNLIESTHLERSAPFSGLSSCTRNVQNGKRNITKLPTRQKLASRFIPHKFRYLLVNVDLSSLSIPLRWVEFSVREEGRVKII